METKTASNIPVKWGRYIDNGMNESKVFFFGHEKAIHGADGERLDTKIGKIEDGISDAFSTEKDYQVGDYCIYLNRLYKFIKDKPRGGGGTEKALFQCRCLMKSKE